MGLTAVSTAAKDFNISMSGLERVEELEQKSSRGNLVPFLSSDPPLSCRFFWSFFPPRYKGVLLERNRQMLQEE